MLKYLVQYQGGGYDGCFWEWNYCIVDDTKTPTEFENIAASGRDGINNLEEF